MFDVAENGVDIVWIVVLSLIFSFAMAWAIGANDVANTFGTSVGAKVLTLRQALVLASIFEFLGAFLLGNHVANTFKKSMIDISFYDDNPEELMVGMTSALIGAFTLLTIATYFCLPVSATHSIVGAVVGFGLVSEGVDGVRWREISLIALSWLVSPLVAGLIAGILYMITRYFVLRSDNSFERGVLLIPFYYFITIAFNVFFIIYKGSGGGYIDLRTITVWKGLMIAVIIGSIICGIVFCFLSHFRIFILNRYYKKLKLNENSFDILTDPFPDPIHFYDPSNSDLTFNNNKNNKNKNNKNNNNNNNNSENDLLYKPLLSPTNNKLNNEKENNNNNDNNNIDLIKAYNTFHNYNNDDNDDNNDNNDDKNEIENGGKGVEIFDGRTEELYSILQILTACFESFAHGSNDVANAIGPLAIIIAIYKTGTVNTKAPIEWWILAGGGVGMVIGLGTWGYRVMNTIGKNLTTVTPSRGFHIEFAAAFTVVVASRLSLPLSTTHCKVGAVVGVGLTEGKNNVINWTLLMKVVGGWVITLPIAAAISAFVFLNLYYLVPWVNM